MYFSSRGALSRHGVRGLPNTTYQLDVLLIRQDRVVRYAGGLDDESLAHAALVRAHLEEGGQARAAGPEVPQRPDVEAPAADAAP